MPPPGGKTPYAQWTDPENVYPVHLNPLLVYDLEVGDIKDVEDVLLRDFKEFGEIKSLFLPKDNIVDGKMFAKIHYRENINAQKAMEGLAHKYKIADGKSSHKVCTNAVTRPLYIDFIYNFHIDVATQVMRKYRQSLSKLDKSHPVEQPKCATSFHDGHICRAAENAYEMIYGA